MGTYPKFFFLSLPSPNSTKNSSLTTSEIWTLLLGFQSILMFFLSASMLILLWAKIFINTQFIPISLAALVHLESISIPSPSSLVNDSLLHNLSSSSAILFVYSSQGERTTPRPHSGGHTISCKWLQDYTLLLHALSLFFLLCLILLLYTCITCIAWVWYLCYFFWIVWCSEFVYIFSYLVSYLFLYTSIGSTCKAHAWSIRGLIFYQNHLVINIYKSHNYIL